MKIPEGILLLFSFSATAYSISDASCTLSSWGKHEIIKLFDGTLIDYDSSRILPMILVYSFETSFGSLRSPPLLLGDSGGFLKWIEGSSASGASVTWYCCWFYSGTIFLRFQNGQHPMINRMAKCY